MAFDQTTRKLLENFVAAARRNLSTEFTRQLQRDYGMDPETGEISDLARLTHLDDSRRQTARLLRETLEHYVAANPTGGTQEALKRIVREQAFTVLNRLCALRMAEARDFLIESIGNGYQSKGFQLYMHLAGTALGETGEAYRCYLFSLFDEFSVDLPVLFDRYSPMGRLFPKPEALVSGNPSKPGIIDLINGPEIAPLWSEDETIGWIYQYFNSKEERKAMRDASAAPRNSRELAVRNQFFTPRYVVEFLTDNTLGRIWYEMRKGETDLKEECRYLVRRPNEIFLAPGENAPSEDEDDAEFSQEKLLKRAVYIEHRPKKDPRDLKVLDPACGSGHFLLYAFDLLARIYEEAWDDPESAKSEASGSTLREDYQTANDFRRNVPELILRWNLHGIDIDHRAVQIAALALWLRAQKSWQNQGIKAGERPRIIKSNIVTAEPMPGEEDMRREFTASLQPRVIGQLVDVVFERMKLAGEAGSLLKIEEEIKDSIAEAKRQWLQGPKPEQQLLFSGMAKPRPKQMALQFDISGVTDEEFWEKVEDRILDALKAYAEQAENGSSVRRRLFAGDAARGFAFIDLCQKHYDVALMNPPFGDPSKASRKNLEKSYKYLSNDMSVCFMQRMVGLLNRCGFVGVLSPRNPLFLESFAAYRRDFLLSTLDFRHLADLGFGVLDNAMIEVVAAVLQRTTEWGIRQSDLNVFRLLNSTQREDDLLSAVRKMHGESVFHVKKMALRRIESTPFCYWLTPGLLKKLAEMPPLKTVADTKWGLFTADDPRFLRAWWEVVLTNDWPSYNKGGAFSRFVHPPDLVLDWRAKGRQIKENRDHQGKSRSRLPNPEFYFARGLSFPNVTFKGLAIRALPELSIFSLKGPGIFPHESRMMRSLLALLNAKIAELFVSAQSPTRRWDIAQISRIPIPPISEDIVRELDRLSIECCQAEMEHWCVSEASRYFMPQRENNGTPANSFLAYFEGFETRLRASREKSRSSLREVDEIAEAIYELDKDDRYCVARFTGDAQQQLLEQDEKELRWFNRNGHYAKSSNLRGEVSDE